MAVGCRSRQTAPELPRVVIVGDSIRLSYAPAVVKQLAGKAMWSVRQQTEATAATCSSISISGSSKREPAVVHFNCGIHDTKKFKSTGKFQVSPEQYEANLRKIVERIRKETDAVVLFAATTPILDDRAAETRRDRDYELLDASVRQYNAIAKKGHAGAGGPDQRLALHTVKSRHPTKVEDLIGSDGVHLKPEAKEILGKAVAAFVGLHLSRHQ